MLRFATFSSSECLHENYCLAQNRDHRIRRLAHPILPTCLTRLRPVQPPSDRPTNTDWRSDACRVSGPGPGDILESVRLTQPDRSQTARAVDAISGHQLSTTG